MKKLLLLNDTRMAGHHGSTAVVNVVYTELAKRGVEVASHLEQPVSADAVAARGFDAVLVNGEGSMHSGQRSARHIAAFAEEASDSGVPVFLINTVFNEHDREIVGRMRRFRAIYCRESRSVEVLRGHGIAAEVCPDLTYAVEVDQRLTWRPGERLVVLDTAVAAKNRALHRFCASNNVPFLPIRTSPDLLSLRNARNLSRIVRFNAAKYAGKLLPQAYALNRYSNAVRRLNDFLQQISDRTRVVIAARFHGVCFCMKIGVPFLAIASNTHKIEGMLEDAGLAHRMIDINQLDLDVIAQRAAWSAEDERRRARYVGAARADIARMFDGIVQHLHEPVRWRSVGWERPRLPMAAGAIAARG